MSPLWIVLKLSRFKRCFDSEVTEISRDDDFGVFGYRGSVAETTLEVQRRTQMNGRLNVYSRERERERECKLLSKIAEVPAAVARSFINIIELVYLKMIERLHHAYSFCLLTCDCIAANITYLLHFYFIQVCPHCVDAQPRIDARTHLARSSWRTWPNLTPSESTCQFQDRSDHYPTTQFLPLAFSFIIKFHVSRISWPKPLAEWLTGRRKWRWAFQVR